MSEDEVKQAYWRGIRLLTLGMILVVAGFTLLLPNFIPTLNAYRILRFPLGYFLLANASVLAMTILIYGFFASQQRSDRTHNMTIQF